VSSTATPSDFFDAFERAAVANREAATLPDAVFRFELTGDDVETYLENLRNAVAFELDDLGNAGSIELFTFTKRLAHRMGLASWGGLSALSAEELDRLVTHFEELIVLRRVVSPIELSDEHQTYRLAPGTLVTTMLSVTNRSAAPGLDEFDARNYRGATFLRAGELPGRELVTTYGHGKHSCPAHRFSTSAIRHATCEIFERFDLVPLFNDARPLRRQIGGVARADRRCEVAYEARLAMTARRSEIVPKPDAPAATHTLKRGTS